MGGNFLSSRAKLLCELLCSYVCLSQFFFKHYILLHIQSGNNKLGQIGLLFLGYLGNTNFLFYVCLKVVFDPI